MACAIGQNSSSRPRTQHTHRFESRWNNPHTVGSVSSAFYPNRRLENDVQPDGSRLYRLRYTCENFIDAAGDDGNAACLIDRRAKPFLRLAPFLWRLIRPRRFYFHGQESTIIGKTYQVAPARIADAVANVFSRRVFPLSAIISE